MKPWDLWCGLPPHSLWWDLVHINDRNLCAQVGLPNVGKSTLFNTLTKLSIPAMNYPFCTIEPNEARVFVPDERFDWLCQVYKPKSEVIPLCCHSFHLCCPIILQHGTVEGIRFSLPPGSLKLLSIFLLFVLWIAGWSFHGLWCRCLHFWRWTT